MSMDMKSVNERILKHPVIRKEVATAYQLGFPWLSIVNAKLCLTYWPHRVVYREEQIAFFSPEYELCFSYPFEMLERFIRLPQPKVGLLVRVSASMFAKSGMLHFNALCGRCEETLETWAADRSINAVARYQRQFAQAVSDAGLSALYEGKMDV